MRHFLVGILVFAACGVSCAQTYPFDTNTLLKNLETLSSDEFEGRRPGQKGGERSRDFVQDQFQALELKDIAEDYLQSFPIKDRDGNSFTAYNVMGMVEGTGHPDEYIVVSSHHDHLGVRDGKIYNGADDNASGTCALFALAQYFSEHPTDMSIIFVAFDAEEWGLQGAKAFLKDPPVDASRIRLNINMDMISRNTKNEIYVTGTRYNPSLKRLVENAKTPLTVSFGHDGADGKQDWTYSSDHGPFHRAKIPFLYFGVEDHKDYHKPTDTFEGVMPKFYIEVVDLVRKVILEFNEG